MKETIKVFSPAETMSPPFGIQLAGTSYCDGSYHIVRECSDWSVIEYVQSGEGTILHNQRLYTARQGDVYILHAGCRHDYASSAANPWVKIWFNLYGEAVEPMLEGYGLKNTVVVPGCGERIGHLFSKFQSVVFAQGDTGDIFTEGALLFHQILIALHRHLTLSSSVKDQEMLQVKNYIDANVDGNLSMEELCAHFHASRSALFQQFKEVFATTPYEYYLNQKLESAKNLLIHSRLRIKEVSNTLCFSDQHYFSGWFKKRTGQSPREFQKSCREHSPM